MAFPRSRGCVGAMGGRAPRAPGLARVFRCGQLPWGCTVSPGLASGRPAPVCRPFCPECNSFSCWKPPEASPLPWGQVLLPTGGTPPPVCVHSPHTPGGLQTAERTTAESRPLGISATAQGLLHLSPSCRQEREPGVLRGPSISSTSAVSPAVQFHPTHPQPGPPAEEIEPERAARQEDSKVGTAVQVGRDTLGACEVVFLREDKSILTIRESRRQVFRGRNCLGTGARTGSGEGCRKQ